MKINCNIVKRVYIDGMGMEDVFREDFEIEFDMAELSPHPKIGIEISSILRDKIAKTLSVKS